MEGVFAFLLFGFLFFFLFLVFGGFGFCSCCGAAYMVIYNVSCVFRCICMCSTGAVCPGYEAYVLSNCFLLVFCFVFLRRCLGVWVSAPAAGLSFLLCKCAGGCWCLVCLPRSRFGPVPLRVCFCFVLGYVLFFRCCVVLCCGLGYRLRMVLLWF